MNYDLIVHIHGKGPAHSTIYFKNNDNWYYVWLIDSIQINLSINQFPFPISDIMLISPRMYLQDTNSPPDDGIMIKIESYISVSPRFANHVSPKCYININGKPAGRIESLNFYASCSNQSGLGTTSLYIKAHQPLNTTIYSCKDWMKDLPDWVQVDVV